MSKKGKRKIWKKVLIGIVAVLLIGAVAGYFIIRNMFSQTPIESAAASDQAIVHTVNGDLRGSLEDGVYQFLGVQYADAKERFALAEEVEPWEGIRDATEVGPMSPQSAMLGMSGGSNEGTSNSSQNMNIWTTGTNDGKK